MNKITAQVAAEAIINHPDDGWEISTIVTVLGDARALDVPSFYVDMLAERLEALRPCACCHARPAGHGHFAQYCEPCSEQPAYGCKH